MLAVRSGSLVYCRRCRAAVPVRNHDKRYLRCDKRHMINSITVALSLSTDDDEQPIRLLPPLHCRPLYWLEEMEVEREAASRGLLEVAG